MNDVETRTREALHDAVDAVRVSERDLDRMESELRAALAHPRRSGAEARTGTSRRRGLGLAAVAAAAVVVGGLALTQDDPQATRPAGVSVSASASASDQPLLPLELVGTWQDSPDSSWVWEFRADGQVLSAMTAADYLEGFRGDRVVTRSGDLLTVASARGCEETVRVRVLRPGALRISVLRSDCVEPEGEQAPELMLERLSPAPDRAGELSVPPVASTPDFAVQASYLDGVFLHVQTGTVLAIGTPGRGGLLRYVIDDDGDGASDPDERGRVTMAESGVAVFRRDAGSGRGACDLRLSSNRMTKERLVTTGAGAGCLPGPGPQVWVRVS